MTTITLQRLTIDNFKGCLHFEFAPMGADCTIAGDNATGKTTVYDALVWLLFGKDSKGRKDFDIKPLDADGNVADHAAITSVEAILDNDGEELKLKRTYYERWTTKRGRSEAEFDGHGSDYYVDDVPVKKNAFDSFVSQLVDETKFRMLTNVSYAAEQMKWQDLRALLFDMAGVQTDEEIMATDPRFLPLSEAKGPKSVEDYKKVLTSQRKGLARAKTDIPARIDEQTQTVTNLKRIDFDALRAQRQGLADREDGYKAQLTKLQSEDATEQLTAQRDKLESDLRAAEADSRALDAENRAYRAGQAPDTTAKRELEYKLRSTEDLISRREADINRIRSDIRTYDAQVDQYRADYMAVYGQEFSEPDTCPTCGQKLPKARMEKARASFELQRQEKLDAIQQNAEHIKETAAQHWERLDQAQTELEALQASLANIKLELADIPAPAPAEDMPDYAERRDALAAQASSLKTQIAETDKLINAKKAPRRKAVADLQQKILGTHHDMEQLDTAIAQAGRLMAAEQRIEELREQAAKASAELEKLDAMLFLIEDFSRYKAHAVEDSINGLFEHATFRLFREQINGGLEECCDVVYNGVPYNSLNNGAQINIGIDLIKAIGQYAGVSVPLFIDNSEAVTSIWPSGSQQIKLRVDEKAKELTIE